MKKGTTLIELVVAMGIFSVIMTLIVGAYITVLRMRSLTGIMRESQQKIRVAEEMLTRLSRQSQKYLISTTASGTVLELYFNVNDSTDPITPPTATKFIYDSNSKSLKTTDCVSIMSTGIATCNSWDNNPQELLGIDNKVELNNFVINRYVDSNDAWVNNSITDSRSGLTKLNIKMSGVINGLSPFYKDDFYIETEVILESLK